MTGEPQVPAQRCKMGRPTPAHFSLDKDSGPLGREFLALEPPACRYAGHTLVRGAPHHRSRRPENSEPLQTIVQNKPNLPEGAMSANRCVPRHLGENDGGCDSAKTKPICRGGWVSRVDPWRSASQQQCRLPD
jgi:hypothetical protein